MTEKRKRTEESWQKACKLGFVGVFMPEAYSGARLGFFKHCFINEEFWQVDPRIAHFILAGAFGSELILLIGAEEQKKTPASGGTQ